jgi:molecular chaperone GrpE
MTDQNENPEEVPGVRPGTPADASTDLPAAEGPDVETPSTDEGPFSAADQAFLDGLSSEASAAAPAAGEDHLEDLRRVTAEYANYRRRVERDRVVERERAVGDAARAILPVLDDLDRAKAHGDLTGGLKAVADKLEVDGVAAFAKSYDDLLGSIEQKAQAIRHG